MEFEISDRPMGEEPYYGRRPIRPVYGLRRPGLNGRRPVLQDRALAIPEQEYGA